VSKVESVNSMQTLIDQIKASNEEKARKTLRLVRRKTWGVR
jgi:hypothetical protein